MVLNSSEKTSFLGLLPLGENVFSKLFNTISLQMYLSITATLAVKCSIMNKFKFNAFIGVWLLLQTAIRQLFDSFILRKNFNCPYQKLVPKPAKYYLMVLESDKCLLLSCFFSSLN